jgi:Tfp pilus assembly protein PilV
MAGKIRDLLNSKTGLSLVETVVAAAIMAIAALILVSFIYTLTGMGKRSEDLSGADAELTEAIALDPSSATDSAPMSITLNGMAISTTHNTYEVENGQFSTFDYAPSSTGTP